MAQGAAKDVTCCECHKTVSIDEFVVNWGSCGPCFDKSYRDYLRSTEEPRYADNGYVAMTIHPSVVHPFND